MEEFRQDFVPEATLDATTQAKLGAGSFGGGKKWWIVFGTVFVILCLVAGWLFFYGGKKGDPVMEVNIGGVSELPSNGEVALQFGLANKDSRIFQDISAEVVYPSGLAYVSSVPQGQDLSGKNFTFPDLSSGQNATVLLRLRVQANVGDTKQLRAIIRYKVAGESAVFVKDYVQSWSVVGRGVELQIQGPSNPGSGDLVTYTLTYENTSDEALDGVKINLEYPSGFEIGQTNPPTNGGSNTWLVPRLESKQKGSISIVGSFSGAVDLQGSLKMTLSVLTKDGGYGVQADTSFPVAIAKRPLTASLEFLDTSKQVVGAGERINYIVKYQNNGSVPVRNAKLLLKVDSRSVDWGEVRAEGAQISQGLITWSPATTDSLNVLSPGDSGSFQVDLKLLDPAAKDSTKNLSISSTVSITSDEFSLPVQGNTLVSKIKTRPALLSGIKYISGSLPPRVGQETFYEITLGVKNTSNDLGGVSVSARLPFGGGSLVKGSLPSGVSLDKTGSKILWDIPLLPAYTGIFSPTKTVTFQVRVVPTLAQVGESLDVLSDLLLSGQDSFVGQAVTAKSLDLTSDKASGSGNGRVVK